MRLWLVGVAFVLSALALIPMSGTARADAQTQVFLVSCLPGANLFEIRDIGAFDKLSGLVAGSTHDLTEKGQALYSAAWAYYRPDIPEDVQEKIGWRSPILHHTHFECRLPANTVELIVVPVFSGRKYGGAVRDIVVSLRIAGQKVVANVPFEPCEDRGPITRLAYEGDQWSVSFEGRFGGVWPNNMSSSEVWDNRQRRYHYGGAKLILWDTIKRDRKAMPIPLTAKDLDYYQDVSNDSYGVSIFDCLPYRAGEQVTAE